MFVFPTSISVSLIWEFPWARPETPENPPKWNTPQNESEEKPLLYAVLGAILNFAEN